LNILIHGVDKFRPVDYIMDHGVTNFNLRWLHFVF
jgi:hypothetical protein